MLFISLDFIFIFVPIAVFGFYSIRRLAGPQWSQAWLVLTSLFFYGFNYPPYLIPLLVSYGVNYLGAVQLQKTQSKPLLIALVGLNFGYIGYFKYLNFLVDNLAAATGAGFHVAQIA